MVVIKEETQTYLVVDSQVIILVDKLNTDNCRCFNSFSFMWEVREAFVIYRPEPLLDSLQSTFGVLAAKMWVQTIYFSS